VKTFPGYPRLDVSTRSGGVANYFNHLAKRSDDGYFGRNGLGWEDILQRYRRSFLGPIRGATAWGPQPNRNMPAVKALLPPSGATASSERAVARLVFLSDDVLDSATICRAYVYVLFGAKPYLRSHVNAGFRTFQSIGVKYRKSNPSW